MIKAIERVNIPECVEVIKKSFMTVADELGNTEENAPRFTAFATTEQRLFWQYDKEKRPMYAYYEKEKLIGYYSLQILDDNVCELNNLCVLPSYRQQKIGEQLLIHAFQQAKVLGCVKMNIGIVEENIKLRKWYERFGFRHMGTKKFDFFPFTCGYMERAL